MTLFTKNDPSFRTKRQRRAPTHVLLALALLLFTGIPYQFLLAQKHSETITRTAVFEDPADLDNTLHVFNINGSVTVEGYAGDEVQISIEQHMDAPNEEELQKGLSELELTVEQDGSHVIVYLDAPFINVKKSGHKISYSIDRWEDEYEFLHDLTIQIPGNTNVDASTINKGNVRLVDISAGEIWAHNVNGEISLENISGDTKARTVNGDIIASYSVSPTGDSTYETINGTIEVTYPTSLSADIRFKSLHGDLYTDFENIRRLNPQVKEHKNSTGDQVSYRVDTFSPIRIGQGGPLFHFEVLNGDVYIKKIKS